MIFSGKTNMVNSRSIKITIAALLASGSIVLTNSDAQAADEYYFFVKNKTSSRIVKLQVSEDKKTWGDFDIGKGIEPGEKSKLIWSSDTDDQDCKQWIRAKFADGSTSQPSKEDFCENLDEPIEFSE